MRLRRWWKPSPKVVRTPEYRFVAWLMKWLHKLPSDPFYENINAYEKVLLYETWLYELELEAEKSRNQAILTGSFSNLEMAQRMVQTDNPKAQTTDIDETSRKVRESILEANKAKNGKRKKRKVVS